MLASSRTILWVCVIFVFGIFSLHTLFPSLISGPHPSLWHVDNGFLNSIWQLHRTHPAFGGRPLTNLGIGILHNYFSIPVGWSFVLINFALLFLCGILLHTLAKQLKLSEKESLWSIVIFYTSFTILLAFFRSIDSYDDLWQYVFVFSSLIFVVRKQWLPLAPLLFLAFLARETTAFVIPGLFVLLYTQSHTNLKSLTPYFLLLAPVVAYVLCEPLILNHYGLLRASEIYAAQTRFTHWQFNFQSLQFGIETVVSLILVFAIPKLLVWSAYQMKNLSDMDKKYITAAILTFIINTPIVLIAGRAREARLLALPLLFIWPLLGKYAFILWQTLRINLRNIPRLLLFTCLLLLSFIFSFFIYRPTFSAGFDWGFQTYCFVTLAVVCIYFVSKDKKQT